MEKEEYVELVEEFYTMLSKDCEYKLQKDLSLTEKRQFIDGFIILRSNEELDEDLIKVQDKILKEDYSCNFVDINALKYKSNCAETFHPIYNLNCDLAVVFSTSLLGDVSNFESLDIKLITHGGLKIKAELCEQFIKNGNLISPSIPFIVKGNNLPCKYLAKIFTKQNINYKNFENIFNFAKKENLTSVAINLTEQSDNLVTIKELTKKLKYKGKIIFCK